MSSEKRDIKNLKEVVDFGFALEKAGVAIFSGGTIHPDKLGEILGIIPTVGPAFSDIDEVPAELSDLDAEEISELVNHIVSKGVLPAKAMAVLDKSIRVAVAGWDLVQVIRE